MGRLGNLGRFLRLWFVLGLSFVLIKLLIDFAFWGMIDLRRVALLQLIVVPFAQSVIYWIVARGARVPASE